MTDKQKMTPEEIREKQKKHAKMTLEDKLNQKFLGSNHVMKNQALYGQLGVSSAESVYDECIKSQKANEVRNEVYKERKEEGDSFDVYGEPAIGNYDISVYMLKQIEESKSLLPLGELEGIVKNIASEFDFEVPEELKNYVPAELYQKTQLAKLSGKNEYELSEQEKDALVIYQELLSKAYNRGAALNSAKENSFADLNSLGKKISEKYNPKKENSY